MATTSVCSKGTGIYPLILCPPNSCTRRYSEEWSSAPSVHAGHFPLQLSLFPEAGVLDYLIIPYIKLTQTVPVASAEPFPVLLYFFQGGGRERTRTTDKIQIYATI